MEKENYYKVVLHLGDKYINTYYVESWNEDGAREMAWGLVVGWSSTSWNLEEECNE